MWALGDYHRFAKRDGLGARARARGGVRDRCRSACARRGRGHGQRGDPRRRGRRRGRGLGPHAGELRGGPPRGARPRGRARVGRGRRRGAARSATASSTSSPPRSARCSPPIIRAWPTSSCACAGPAARSGMINFTPEGLAGGVLRGLRALRAAASAGSAAADPLGKRGARARAVRRPGRVARDDSPGVRRARREPACLHRALQADLRARHRAPCIPRRPARPRGGARPGVPRVRDARQPRRHRTDRPSTTTSTCSSSPASAAARQSRIQGPADERTRGRSAPAPRLSGSAPWRSRRIPNGRSTRRRERCALLEPQARRGRRSGC